MRKHDPGSKHRHNKRQHQNRFRPLSSRRGRRESVHAGSEVSCPVSAECLNMILGNNLPKIKTVTQRMSTGLRENRGEDKKRGEERRMWGEERRERGNETASYGLDRISAGCRGSRPSEAVAGQIGLCTYGFQPCETAMRDGKSKQFSHSICIQIRVNLLFKNPHNLLNAKMTEYIHTFLIVVSSCVFRILIS